MNEREIRALLKETTRAAKAYKADLQRRTELQARINAGVKPNTPTVNPLNRPMGKGAGLGGGGTLRNVIR